jgi:hypothetical protein
MCEPTLATALLISGAQSVLQIQAANQQYKAQEAQFAQNRNNAIAARDVKARQENLKLQQESEAIAEKKLNQQIEAKEIRGRQIVSAGESGVGGGVLEALVRDTEATNLRNASAANAQVAGLRQQSAVNRQGMDAEAQNRINSVQRGQKPNALAIVAGNALSAYGSYNMAKM